MKASNWKYTAKYEIAGQTFALASTTSGEKVGAAEVSVWLGEMIKREKARPDVGSLFHRFPTLRDVGVEQCQIVRTAFVYGYSNQAIYGKPVVIQVQTA